MPDRRKVRSRSAPRSGRGANRVWISTLCITSPTKLGLSLGRGVAALHTRADSSDAPRFAASSTCNFTVRHRRILAIGIFAAFLGLGVEARAKERVHQVASGQTLTHISKAYGVNVTALVERNGLVNEHSVRAGQRLVIPESNWRPSAKAAAKGIAAPQPYTQTQKSAQERGINPCNTPDPGFGAFAGWDRSPAMGQMIVPQAGALTARGEFDVVFHFHGHEAARKEWVQAINGIVLVGIDLGNGSGAYSAAFNAPSVFEQLLRSVEAGVAKHFGIPRARARHIGLSAWSAGYGAVQEILGTEYGRKNVDAVILLDALHTGYVSDNPGNRVLNQRQIQSFVDFAALASRKKRLMFMSHSSIIPPGYASTTETANLVVQAIGGRPTQTRPRAGDPMGLELVSRFSHGNFHMRGFSGNDKMDHCAHFGLLQDVARVHLAPRWNSPRGYRAKSKPAKAAQR